MSAFLVILHRDGSAVDARLVDSLLKADPGRGFDGSAVRLLGPAALGHQHLHSLPEDAADEQPIESVDGGRAIAFDGRIDNREQLCRELGLGASGPSDARLVLAAHRAWGDACVERLRGDFGFALWIAQRRAVLVGRDVLGTRGVAYYLDDRLFVAATDVETVLAHPDVPATIDEVKVALFLANDWRDQQRSFFAAVQYLEPAHTLVVDAGAACRRRYWDLDLSPRASRIEHREAATELRSVLSSCTADRLRCRGPVGVSLSGGLDSSTVAALAAVHRSVATPADRPTTTPLRAYSFVFDDVVACDERPWIEQTARMHGLETVFVPCDDCWTLRDVDSWPKGAGFVDADAFGRLPAAVRTAAHRDGTRLLLTGHFGDVPFLAGIYWFSELLHDRHLGQAATILWRTRRHVRWRADLWELGLRQLLPGSIKARYRRSRPRSLAERAPAVSACLARRADLEERLQPSPATARWHRPGASARYVDLALGPRAQGLAASRPAYERLGIELADPFHDRRIVELLGRLPAVDLALPGQTKRLLRTATVGLLPEAVRTRSTKTDFGPLFRLGLLDRERSTVEVLLREPRIVARDYVDEAWLRREIARGSAWTQSGFPLWQCIALELWLREREAGAVPHGYPG